MNDYIDRQAAIDALERIFDRCEEIEAHFPDGDPDKTGYKMFPDYMTVWKYLHQLPSAQPERKKGKWLEYNATGKKQWMCSECCAEEKNPKVARFCYWCGADMRGERDE